MKQQIRTPCGNLVWDNRRYLQFALSPSCHVLWTNFEILMCLKVIFHYFHMPNRFLVRLSTGFTKLQFDFRLPTSEFRFPGLLSSDVRVPSSDFWVPTSWFFKITTSERHTANHVTVGVWTAKTPTDHTLNPWPPFSTSWFPVTCYGQFALLVCKKLNVCSDLSVWLFLQEKTCGFTWRNKSFLNCDIVKYGP